MINIIFNLKCNGFILYANIFYWHLKNPHKEINRAIKNVICLIFFITIQNKYSFHQKQKINKKNKIKNDDD